MDIQAANTPTKAKAAASDKQDKSKVEDGREGAPAFAQLLQGLQPPAALEARAAAQDVLGDLPVIGSAFRNRSSGYGYGSRSSWVRTCSTWLS